jgi:hypothetical protein
VQNMTLPLIEASNPSVVPWSSVGNNTLLRPYASAIEKSPDAYQLSHPRGRKTGYTATCVVSSGNGDGYSVPWRMSLLNFLHLSGNK